MPFKVATILCLLGLIFGFFALPAGGAPKAHESDEPAEQVTVEEVVDVEAQRKEPKKNIWCDKVMLLAFISHFGFGVVIVGMAFMENLLILRNQSFGVVDPNDSDEEQKVAVAQIVTLIVMPLGLISTFISVVIYPRLSMSWGDSVSIFIFGAIFSAALLLEGLTTELWQVFACSGLQGVGLGILMPALGPLLAIYAGAVYPSQVSETISMPQIGLAVGLMVGSNIVQGVDVSFESRNVDGERAGFVFTGVACFLSSAGMALVGHWVNLAVEERQLKQSEQEKNAFLENRGQNPSKFSANAAEHVSTYLKEKAKQLQNQPMQDLVMHNLLSSVPKLPSWNNATQGKEYLEALHKELQHAGLEKHDETIRARFLVPVGIAGGGMNFRINVDTNIADDISEASAALSHRSS